VVRGKMKMWSVTDVDNRPVGYLYGCLHGRDLMTPDQMSSLCSSDQLFLEHDYLTLPRRYRDFVMMTYPDPSDEWRLDKEFHQMGRRVIGLDRFEEFPQEEARYDKCSNQNCCLLRERLNEMCKKINRGSYGFSEMRLTDLELFADMRQFLSTRENKWFGMILEGVSRGTVSIAVGLGHVYPLACRFAGMGYKINRIESSRS
jgi:hypothetical protein